MEKVCEFCMALRPAVYCQADSALLCLSCDLKVHSANALSNRHLRFPLCDSCQAFPASVRCDDHRMYMCRSCDRSLHSHSGPSSKQKHQKRAINSYIGCPSAEDLAALWDLDLSELGDASRSTVIVSSQEFVEFGNASLDAIGQYYQQPRGGSLVGSVMSCTTNSVRDGMHREGMNNKKSNKISPKGQQQQQRQNQSSRVIVQQILDLQRLQLNEGNRYSPIVRGEEKKDMSSSSGKALRRIDEAANENSQHSLDLEAEFLKSVTPLEELRLEGFSSPFSSLENLSSLTAGVFLLGDSFWQCRSPLQTGQFMSQSVQDLGLFEDLSCRDNFNNIPDVDMTFKSFEELFEGDQDPTRGLLTSDNNLSCSSMDREISFDKSESSHAPVMENASAIPSAYLDPVTHVNSDACPLKQVSRLLQPSYSVLSFSISQATEGASSSTDPGAADLETKENGVTRNRDKKKARLDGENTRQALCKDRTDVRKRLKGRQSSKSGNNPDDVSTRSY